MRDSYVDDLASDTLNLRIPLRLARICIERDSCNLICPECTRHAEDSLIVGTMTSSPFDWECNAARSVARSIPHDEENSRSQLDIFTLFTWRVRSSCFPPERLRDSVEEDGYVDARSRAPIASSLCPHFTALPLKPSRKQRQGVKASSLS